ncbi:MAG: tetratricopeptide repeat protein [Panacagrimonas sp.]
MKPLPLLIYAACWMAMISVLSGCAVTEAQRRVTADTEREIASADSPAKREGIHTDLIRGMLAQNQYYAAIAHIQAQTREAGVTPELQLLEAEARRKLGQLTEAQTLYRGLLKSPFVAEAYHGLGLISAPGNLATGIWQLQQAVARKPTNATMRNDLGYALMIGGRYREAMLELSTAVELEAGSGDERARNNLVLLLVLKGDEAGVRRMAQQSSMTPETLAGLRRQAQNLKRPPAAKAAAAPKSS